MLVNKDTYQRETSTKWPVRLPISNAFIQVKDNDIYTGIPRNSNIQEFFNLTNVFVNSQSLQTFSQNDIQSKKKKKKRHNKKTRKEKKRDIVQCPFEQNQKTKQNSVGGN